MSGLILHEVVHATPLVRLSIQGAVARPGYYDIPADVRLSDVVTKAGGTTPNADTKNVVIRRGDEVIWGAKDVQTALTDGLSVDRLNMRAGDEITVGVQRSPFSWQVIRVGAFGRRASLTLTRKQAVLPSFACMHLVSNSTRKAAHV